jgi:DegV family protein with EDD domain
MRLTAENTAVVLDSTADLPDAHLRHPNWRMVPLYVRFGEDVYHDYLDLTPAQFYERLAVSPEPPRTSQPTPADFASVFAELDGYERVLCLLLSARLSGTYESACLAAAETGDERVVVLDSTVASGGTVLLADAVQRRLERGTDDEELRELVPRYAAEAGLYFTVDTLDYLVRGGRVGRAAGFAGQLLSVKPILSIQDGEVVPVKRVRGRSKALDELVAVFEQGTADGPGLHAGIAHALAPVEAGGIADEIRRLRPQASIDLVTTLGPVVGAHAGPGTIGLFWFRDDP